MSATRRSGAWIAVLAAVSAVPTWIGCGQGGQEPAEPASMDVVVVRERAAAMLAEGSASGALEALRPLLEGPDVAGEDLLRAGILHLELGDLDSAEDALRRAEDALPDSPAVAYNLGRIALANGEMAAAAEHALRAHELAPDDLPTVLFLASALMDADDPAAEPYLQRIVDLGPDAGGSWHLAALYRLGRLRLQDGQADEAEELFALRAQLQAQGVPEPQPLEIERGTFGLLAFPDPRSEPPAPRDPGALAPEPVLVPGLAGVSGVLDLPMPPPATSRALLGWGDGGIVEAVRGEDGAWTAAPLFDGPVSSVSAADVDRDGDLDAWVLTPEGPALLVRDEEGALAPFAGELPALPDAADARDLTVVDFDHDGDLDLLVVGGFGARLWRNDGLSTGGAFADASAEAGLPGLSGGRAFDWCVVEDFDTDEDVDLLFGGAGGAVLASSLRGGRFERGDASALGATRERPVVADLGGDGRPDVWIAGAPPKVLRGRISGGFEAAGTTEPARDRSPDAVVDLNLDGELDGLWRADGGGAAASATLSLGTPRAKAVELLPGVDAAGASALLAGDLEGDGTMDVALVRADGLALHAGSPSDAGWVRVALAGKKDNLDGVGAVVEVRAGAVYQRHHWRGVPRLLGLGDAPKADWLRVIWPNGVRQTLLDVEAGSNLVLEQKSGLAGSCPFLYTWNGTTFEFVTDVLGITPLGLPMGPGMLVPPDHDEYVLIRGEQLRPRDGVLELQVTEELREVTYLDRVRLDAVDHPAESEVYPEEHFTFPPFPAPEIHAVTDLHAPSAATGSDGVDWTAALAAVDFEFAAPFDPYRTCPVTATMWGGQYQGLAPMHHLELAFPPEAVAGAEKLRLVMTGWFFWTDASVNMAASRAPGVDFVPPHVLVPDPEAEGGWREALPSIGFPAGKQKSMVVDLTGVLDPADPRLRVQSSLRLYWDSIRLATDAGDAPVVVTSLEPEEADLWQRGFSRGYELGDGKGLEWFEWDALEEEPRWNQHPGLYTRLGDVLPLLGDIDDRFVIFGAGDAIALRFDATALPPVPEGWRRDYLLFLDGWAKDRDPNTLAAEHVEPLPFHGMSGYPYGADESFPDDAEHRAWRREWNTRPARRWIEPLAPPVRPVTRPTGTPAAVAREASYSGR